MDKPQKSAALLRESFAAREKVPAYDVPRAALQISQSWSSVRSLFTMGRPMPQLIYVHDPMCSWCWAFQPLWSRLLAQLPSTVSTLRLLGGLAPDTDAPMPDSTRKYVQANWRRIEEVVPGTRFNYEFWTRCQPRRATYPACRAVIAARMQDPAAEETMVCAIQRAYYLQARNPSDTDTLVELAAESGLDIDVFASSLNSPQTQAILSREIAHSRSLGTTGFPALMFQIGDANLPLRHDYRNEQVVLKQIAEMFAWRSNGELPVDLH